MTYQRLCKLLAARRCHDAGLTVKEIAQQAGVAPSTVRNWLKQTGG